MQTPTTLMGHILNQAPLLVAWVTWLIVVNSASVAFVWRHVEARWVLAAWILNFAVMNVLFEAFGFVRILGLAHVLVWPLLVYLWRRLPALGDGGAFRVWTLVLLASNGLSLVIDDIDVARCLLGDRQLPT